MELSMSNSDDMVLVRNAWKTLGSKKVLCSLNMTVKKQTIYGLLGPSSCGKTTLLSCILGLKRLDAGSIDVKLSTLKEVGYMPQEPALYDNFTPDELFYFFGSFFGMSVPLIKERMIKLSEFLEITDCRKRLIGDCSGGQKRRVSLIVSLLHNPKLLILDEPTVGMDCILSERIWQYMTALANEGKTIIITTHYIQEAKSCTMIGLMRYGALLEEKSPQELMTLHNSSDLEDIFLDVCKEQDQKNSQQAETVPKKPLTKMKYENYKENKLFDKNRFIALLYKNMLQTRRNTLAFLGLLILPMLIAFLYSYTQGKNPKGIRLGVVSEEITLDQGFAKCEDIPDEFNAELNCTIPKYLSCAYLEELKKKYISLVPYENNENADRDILRNEVWGSIEFPQNFTESLVKRLENNWNIPEEFIDNSILYTRLDGTNYVMRFILRNHLYGAMEKLMNNILSNCGLSEKYQVVPMRVHNPIYGLKEMAFDQNSLPGFICAFSFYTTIMFTTSSLITEKVDGVTARGFAAGMTYLEIMLSHTIFQFILMILQNIGMFYSFYGFLGYESQGSLILALLLAMSVNCVGITLGFVITSLFNTQFAAMYSAIGAVISVFNLVEVTWPKEGMHYLLTLASPLIPIARIPTSMRSIIFRNFGLSHPFVFSGFLYNIGWSIVLIVASFIIQRLNK